MATKKNVLEEALGVVTGDRDDAHGHPEPNMHAAAMMWSAILRTPVTATDVALCMMAFKIARQSNRSGRDNIVDIAGYCWVLEQCAAAQGWEL